MNWAVTAAPITNQAPASAARKAPQQPHSLLLVGSTIRPPSTAATPGAISSHSRPDVYAQAWSGV